MIRAYLKCAYSHPNEVLQKLNWLFFNRTLIHSNDMHLILMARLTLFTQSAGIGCIVSDHLGELFVTPQYNKMQSTRKRTLSLNVTISCL